MKSQSERVAEAVRIAASLRDVGLGKDSRRELDAFYDALGVFVREGAGSSGRVALPDLKYALVYKLSLTRPSEAVLRRL